VEVSGILFLCGGNQPQVVETLAQSIPRRPPDVNYEDGHSEYRTADNDKRFAVE
jgi:hypothetical protein